MRRLSTFGLLSLISTAPLFAQSHKASDLGRAVVSAGVDTSACYRIRDLQISEEDVQLYLTDGYIMFGKPVDGAPISAVFSAEVEGGDAEVLLLPPNRSERRALASYTSSPTLDEHFTNGVFFFTEAEARGLAAEIRAKGEARPAPEVGAILADQWSAALAALANSFETRLVLDLLDDSPSRKGFFEAILQGKKLGNFDVNYDARAPEQIYAGQTHMRDGKAYWDVWTSFAARSRRNQPPPDPEEEILAYRIDAHLDSALALHCVMHIRIRSTADSRNAIPFDLSAQMHATAAKIDGEPAEVFSSAAAANGVRGSGNGLILVIPPRPLAPGSEHEIEIAHEGNVVEDAGHQVYLVAARGTWYPNRGAQFASYDVTWTYPKTLDLIGAGQVKEDRTEGDVRITRRVPAGRLDILGFNLGNYKRRTIERNGIEIDVNANSEIEDALRIRQPAPTAGFVDAPPLRRRWTLGGTDVKADDAVDVPPPIGPEQQLTGIAEEIAAAFDFYRARFGDPPLKHIEVSPLPVRFGQGYPGMIYLPTLSYLPLTARPLSLLPPWQQVFYSELLRAHEAAHQWWGNIVTPAGYRHEWLMEALANYSALLYLESRKGPKFLDGLLGEYRRELLVKGPDGAITEAEGPVVEGRRLESSNNPGAWNAIAYGKGSWILHMLRRRMGDAQFTKMLAELRRRYEWKTIDTEQFRGLCAEFLPKGSPDKVAPDPTLENFFDEWVYGTGIPALKLSYAVKGKPGAWRLTGVVTQSAVPDDFSVLVPIEIETGHGKVTRQIATASDPVSFSVPVSAPNAKAVLDPGQSVLRR